MPVSTQADTHACVLRFVHAHRVLTQPIFPVKFKQPKDKRGQISCAQPELLTCQQPVHICQTCCEQFSVLLISLTPRPPTLPRHQPPSSPSSPKRTHTRKRTHIHTHTQGPVNSVSLCSLPYTCRAPGRTGGLWVGVVFAYRVVANKPSITEIHKKKGMRDRSRGRSPGGWVA